MHLPRTLIASTVYKLKTKKHSWHREKKSQGKQATNSIQMAFISQYEKLMNNS